ncbi:MAG TPA: DivIVA domain-containing protein, partial [Acidimicrobiales bacterium]|nr:DivIVA domain-containing protein [Acidimicrobiales bacterium]
MALRVSPERVRDVRFAEQWRGYRTDEVDEFVDQVADAFDQLEARLEDAAQRTARAERRLEERKPDEDLGRTLVLAQRTADAALAEAQAEAARLVDEAEQRARAILDELEERKARLETEIEARIQAELVEMNERRAALETDVERLSSYVEHHRSRLVEELRTSLGWLEREGALEPLAVPFPRSPAAAPTTGPRDPQGAAPSPPDDSGSGGGPAAGPTDHSRQGGDLPEDRAGDVAENEAVFDDGEGIQWGDPGAGQEVDEAEQRARAILDEL